MDLQPNKIDGIFLPITNKRISASEWNQLVGSCMAFITEAGLTPDASDNEQFLNAFKAIAAGLELVGANTNLSNLTQAGKDLFVPVGCLQMAPLTSLTGYLLCDGSAVSRATYSALFAAIGTNFGAGDGSTTFNVPDYRNCFLRGLGSSNGTMYQKQPMGAPDIDGTARIGGVGSSPIYISPVSGALYTTQSTNYMTRGENQGPGPTCLGIQASRSNSVYGSAEEIRPVNYAVNIFIKY